MPVNPPLLAVTALHFLFPNGGVPAMALPPILTLSPVLALLVVVPGYSQYAGRGGRPLLLYDRTLPTERQCNKACRINPACNRYIFEERNSKCYFFWCPDVSACQNMPLEDLLSNHEMNDHSVFGPAGSVSDRTTTASSPRPGDGTAAETTTDSAVAGLQFWKPSDTSALLAILLFSLLFLVIVVLLFLRKALGSYRRKGYTRMGYLIDGMYSESSLGLRPESILFSN
ncbi:hypothetical protein ANANG_G00201770 [Anguilla anguilla]|uniref:MANSC domain-containing protein n=1 Tax=Anguilla anguilla TaxID=7936 RepID=A0A9D3RR42_ANGAN|nr:hypothetical protein ANANG_G00201770 [Anguilla anguilla]